MARVRDGIIRRGRTWSYVIRVTDLESGRSKPKWVGGFVSEAEAKAARDLARVAVRRKEYVDRSPVTVAQYLDRWLEAHRVELKPNTYRGYRDNLASYVHPRIGSLRLQALTSGALSALYRDLSQSGGRGGAPLSPTTIDYVHAVLRKALNDAVEVDGLIPKNPALRAKKPRRDQTRVAVLWTADDLRRFLDHAAGHRLGAFYRLAAYTGARRGELLNVRWSDLDLDGCRLRVVGSTDVVDGVRVDGTTKGGRERTVSLDSGTVEILRQHKRRQEEDREFAGTSWVVGDLVFRRQLGDPLYPDTVSALMRKITDEYNVATSSSPLPAIRLHDLRHLHATFLLRAAVPVHVVAARLGHRDPAITLRVYAHVIEQQATEVAGVFASLVEASERLAVSSGVSN
ncbi:tyrosine-type recombinase/integrase [Aquipuribacter hungaricus]|uniref:Tyrosine-type recombinase/integrase n=1 Tax=Aquipuribacter hungaricus TaxID=545624 RepID=A0ABV7WBB6_9MICO